MFVVHSYPLAVIFCVVTMLGWGSWANAKKLARPDWRFELFYWDYTLGVLLSTLMDRQGEAVGETLELRGNEGVILGPSKVPVPPVFRWLSRQGGVAEAEMLRTFNCGIGMVAIVRREAVERITEVFTASGESVALLGEVIAAAGEHRVVYNGHLDLAR